MKHSLISLAVLAVCGSAAANPIYYSRCDNTADVVSDPSCVPGNDANNGLSPAAPKLTPPSSITNGVTYRFARNGAWDSFPYRSVSGRSNWTVEAYTPEGCTGDCATRRPQIGATIKADSCPDTFFFVTGASQNYTIKDMHFVGKHDAEEYLADCSNNRAVYFYANVAESNVGAKFENNYVTRTQTALHLAATTDAAAEFGNRNIQVRNNIFYNIMSGPIFGGGQGFLVEGNLFEHTAWIGKIDQLPKDAHHLYLSSSLNANARGMVVRGNVLTRQNQRVGNETDKCDTSVLMGHGYMTDLTIEDNLIYEPPGKSEGGCYGIAVDGSTSGGKEAQKLDRLTIRRNKVILPEVFIGIGTNAAPNATIESNLVVVYDGTDSAHGIVLGSYSSSIQYQPARGDSAPGPANIRNNSLYINSTGTFRGACLAYRYAEYSVPTPTGQDSITNNLCVYGPKMNATERAWGLEGQPSSRFAAFSNNVVYYASGTPVWSDAYSTIANFQTAFGAVAVSNSSSNPEAATPTLGNNWSMALSNGANFAVNGGHTTRAARTDVDRYLRVGIPDIGAFEFGRTTLSPYGPTGGRVN